MCKAWNLKWHWNIFSCISIILAFLLQGTVGRNAEVFSLYIHLWLLFLFLELQIQSQIMMDASLRVQRKCWQKRRALNKATTRAQDVKLKIECHGVKWWSHFPFDFCCNNWGTFGVVECSVMYASSPRDLNHGCDNHMPSCLEGPFHQWLPEPSPGRSEVSPL